MDFELPHADTGHKGFSKEAMHCAFIVMKSEGFSLITDLTALAVAYAAVLNESCHSYRSLKHLRRAGDPEIAQPRRSLSRLRFVSCAQL